MKIVRQHNLFQASIFLLNDSHPALSQYLWKLICNECIICIPSKMILPIIQISLKMQTHSWKNITLYMVILQLLQKAKVNP